MLAAWCIARIELDEESDRILTELAGDYNGDLGQALGDLLQSHEGPIRISR